MNERRKLLMVSFFYPPDPAVGGLRVAKFAQYLPESGWHPTVLTARTAAGDSAEHPAHVDATRFISPWRLLSPKRRGIGVAGGTALRERAGRGGVVSSAAYSALRHVLPMSSVRMPDATLGWVPFAVAQGRRLLDSADFHAILSSSGPPSSHVVAARLQRHSGLPWIADYRDSWSDNHWDVRIGPFRRLERRLERRVLRRASLLTTVAPALAEQLETLHAKNVEVVYNGFDPADYPSVPKPANGFTVVYVGTLNRPNQNPEPVFQALAQLNSRPDLDLDRLRFQLCFLGTASGAVADLARQHRVSQWVRHEPAVPHHESLARQAGATALLFLGWSDPHAGVVTAKLFEYLGARRPILAVGTAGGSVSRILRECGLPDLSNDPPAIAARLEGWLREFAESGTLKPPASSEAVARYTRRAQTRRMADLLDGLSRGRS
ncbi:MAG: glycosyltransferase [Gemmatimonadota bacterium]|nr:MAG: glycosyltransferase [Gemmatimonadota bacterium]